MKNKITEICKYINITQAMNMISLGGYNEFRCRFKKFK